MNTFGSPTGWKALPSKLVLTESWAHGSKFEDLLNDPKQKLAKIVVWGDGGVMWGLLEVGSERLALFGFIAAERPVPPAWRMPAGPTGRPVLPPSWREDARFEWYHEGWARDFHHHFRYTERGKFNY